MRIKVDKKVSFATTPTLISESKRDQKKALLRDIAELRECGFGKYRMEKRVKPNQRFGYMEMYINKK